MRYGHFDDEAREYVITTPRTPYPWINYLGSQEFFSLVSHTAGGYTFYRDARMRRLTRYRYNNIPNDAGGRYFFLNDGGDVWTPSWMPVKAELDSFEARHGMGYTRITGSRGGLSASVLYFVPLGRNAEVQQVTLTNHHTAAKSVGLFSFLEFALWNAHDDQTNYQRNLSLAEMEVELDGPHGSAIYQTPTATRSSGRTTRWPRLPSPVTVRPRTRLPRAGTRSAPTTWSSTSRRGSRAASRSSWATSRTPVRPSGRRPTMRRASPRVR